MGVYLWGKSRYIDFYCEGKQYTEKVGKVSKGAAEEKPDVKRAEHAINNQNSKKITNYEKKMEGGEGFMKRANKKGYGLFIVMKQIKTAFCFQIKRR